jgi:hypothetical protein
MDLEHLAVVDLGVALDEREDGVGLNRYKHLGQTGENRVAVADLEVTVFPNGCEFSPRHVHWGHEKALQVVS